MAFTKSTAVSRDMEVRHLDVSKQVQLSQILDRNDQWKELMEKIPKNLNDIHKDGIDFLSSPRKYKADSIRLIEEASRSRNVQPTTILIEEWGTSGQRRATVDDLLKLLIKAGMYRAADYVATKILNEPPPQRPSEGPAARIDITPPPDNLDEPISNGSTPNTSNGLNNEQNQSSERTNGASFKIGSQSNNIPIFLCPQESALNTESEINGSSKDVISASIQTNGFSSKSESQSKNIPNRSLLNDIANRIASESVSSSEISWSKIGSQSNNIPDPLLFNGFLDESTSSTGSNDVSNETDS